MTDRPILFSAPMIRALLDGRKTQTRRIIKPQPAENVTSAGVITRSDVGQTDEWTWLSGDPRDVDTCGCAGNFATRFRPGDRLWVKETWKPGSWREDARVACDYRASPELVHTPWCRPENFEDLWPKWTDELVANGSAPDAAGIHHWEPGKSPLKWRPSIYMPRWASRLTLIVIDVRVERLQDISEPDAIAEGVVWQEPTEEDRATAAAGDDNGVPYEVEGVWTVPGAKGLTKADVWGCTAAQSYRFLWDAINGTGAWEANPWVVAITFTVHHHNIDQELSA